MIVRQGMPMALAASSAPAIRAALVNLTKAFFSCVARGFSPALSHA
jgi:hypothetical protein